MTSASHVPKKSGDFLEILLANGKLSQEQLSRARDQAKRGTAMQDALLAEGCAESDLLAAMAQASGLTVARPGWIDWAKKNPYRHFIPEDFARRARAVPLGVFDGKLYVGFANPTGAHQAARAGNIEPHIAVLLGTKDLDALLAVTYPPETKGSARGHPSSSSAGAPQRQAGAPRDAQAPSAHTSPRAQEGHATSSALAPESFIAFTGEGNAKTSPKRAAIAIGAIGVLSVVAVLWVWPSLSSKIFQDDPLKEAEALRQRGHIVEARAVLRQARHQGNGVEHTKIAKQLAGLSVLVAQDATQRALEDVKSVISTLPEAEAAPYLEQSERLRGALNQLSAMTTAASPSPAKAPAASLPAPPAQAPASPTQAAAQPQGAP